MDFGLAKERKAGAELQKLTATGIILGTPEFMSPEQLRGKPLDARTDIYSLALMTYEMLTGKLPFQGRTQQEMMIARLRSDPTPLRKMRPGSRFPRIRRARVDQGACNEIPTIDIRRATRIRRRVRGGRGGAQARRRARADCSENCSADDRVTLALGARALVRSGAVAAAASSTRADAQQDPPYRPAFDVVGLSRSPSICRTPARRSTRTRRSRSTKPGRADTLALDLARPDGESGDGRRPRR